MKIGQYEPREMKKGVDETVLPVKEGGVFWVIQIDKHTKCDVLHQESAEIISRLVRIENLLRKRIWK